MSDDYLSEWKPKMLREKLVAAKAPDAVTHDAIRRLVEILDLHRPLGKNGKHGNLHTPTCGCEDRDMDYPSDRIRADIASKIDLRYLEAANRHDKAPDSYTEGLKDAYDISEQIAQGLL